MQNDFDREDSGFFLLACALGFIGFGILVYCIGLYLNTDIIKFTFVSSFVFAIGGFLWVYASRYMNKYNRDSRARNVDTIMFVFGLGSALFAYAFLMNLV